MSRSSMESIVNDSMSPLGENFKKQDKVPQSLSRPLSSHSDYGSISRASFHSTATTIAPSVHSNSEVSVHDVEAAVVDPSDPGPPPDGGLQAWLQVLAGHLGNFNAWGFINSFGIFQGMYAQQLNLPPSTVSWIGSTQIFLIFAVGTFSGRALDAGYYRHTLFAALFLQLLGVFMTSLAGGQYYALFLAQGVCQGLGCGLFFCPTVALVGTYFKRKRVFAVSGVAAGGATGGIIFPLIAQKLLPVIGTAWTIRVMGFVILFNSIIIIAIAKPRLPARKSGPLFEFSAFRERAYSLFAIGMFFTLWGLYFSFYYARVYAINVLGETQDMSFIILLVLNAVGLPGRMVPAFIADRFFPGRPIIVLAPVVLITSLCLYLWSLVSSVSGYWAWIVFFGWFGAAIQALWYGAIAGLSPDPSKAGTRIGMVFTIVSFACLTGPPLAGQLIQTANGSYLIAQMWGGSMLLIGSGFLLWAQLSIPRPVVKSEKTLGM